MKDDTHPEYHPVIFKDGEHEIITRSTATSKITREVDGVEHYVVNVDISAFTHPFYTGQKKLVDSEGRVDRFRKRYNLEEEEEETGESDTEASDEEESEAQDDTSEPEADDSENEKVDEESDDADEEE